MKQYASLPGFRPESRLLQDFGAIIFSQGPGLTGALLFKDPPTHIGNLLSISGLLAPIKGLNFSLLRVMDLQEEPSGQERCYSEHQTTPTELISAF